MSRAILTSMLTSLLLALPNIVVADDNSWPSAPSRLELNTPYGDLEVHKTDYVFEARLQFDGQNIEPRIEGLLNIPYAYQLGSDYLALVSIDSGSDHCPV